MSISTNREKKYYRFLEGFLGYLSISFLTILFILSFAHPVSLSLFLIGYSFLMVLKVSLHGVYTIYAYKNLRRWESLDWTNLINTIPKNRGEALDLLKNFQKQHNQALDWEAKLNTDIENFEAAAITKFQNPKDVFHIPIFALYNEPVEVLTRSLRQIYESGYPLDKIAVFVSQEARVGEQHYLQVIEDIKGLDWVNVNNTSETDLDIVYSDKHSELGHTNSDFKKIKLNPKKLNLIFTQHPDGLVGEIKGKASNEDWGARQASIFVDSQNIDPEMVILTSLDSDSKVGQNFFQMLSFRYCITPNQTRTGFQPLPVYTNNFFEANLFPRLVATNTTIWHMIQYSLLDELHFFANYCVPMVMAREVNFWNREVIAEDSMMFTRCWIYYHGKFKVVPFYGTFEGDAVDGDDYFENIISQYKQLQRWAWGGIEGFPFKFKSFFIDPEGSKIELRKKIRLLFLEAQSHFFWATSPIVFSIIVLLPQIIASRDFRESALQINLWLFSQYFAWLSFIFLVISGWISFKYIGKRANTDKKAKWYHWIAIVSQWFISPLIFIMWGPPALDVQLRGIFSKYLGYWVTPKK